MSVSNKTGLVGYSRYEFGKIFQVYSQNVYGGLFRDFSFSEIGGQYFISFAEEAGKVPLITVEKRRLGPDRSLFVAPTPGAKGEPVQIVRSEKIENFTERLKAEIDALREDSARAKSLRIVS